MIGGSAGLAPRSCDLMWRDVLLCIACVDLADFLDSEFLHVNRVDSRFENRKFLGRHFVILKNKELACLCDEMLVTVVFSCGSFGF